MTGLSLGAMLPLFYGAKPEDLEKFGFTGMQFAVASDSTSQTNKTPGQRNLFEPVANLATEIYTGQGLDCEQRAATRKMLQQLAIHMKKCPWPGAKNKDNDKIPAGYTYLAQLAAHDLVNNSSPLPRLDDVPGYFARDYRTGRLMLDTIYGGGPAATPLPFELAHQSRSQRHRLRLGYVLSSDPAFGKPRPLPMMDQPPRDIGRVACPFLSDDYGTPRAGVPDALLADPRNDDHLIISQLTALFHQLHNIIDLKLRHIHKTVGALDDFIAYRIFLDARKMVAIVYRSVIVNDLLCKLLEPSVYSYYKADTTKYPANFLDTTDDGRVPVEFSHAVYRFGHVMTQFDYVLNEKLKNGRELFRASIGDILDRSSARDAWRLPLASNWLVDWSRFFDLGDGTEINFSRPIRPYVGEGGLTENSDYFPNEDKADGGIFYRDLIRGADAGVRTVDSLIKYLRCEDRDRSRLLFDRGYRQQKILDWLTQCPETAHSFCPADRLSLTQDPPLLFFVLFEAAHTQGGERLGILGSVLLAEVFFAAYKRSFDTMEGDQSLPFRAYFNKMFPNGVPSNMPAVIQFVKSEGGLADVQCKN
jgi:hypothetical protein